MRKGRVLELAFEAPERLPAAAGAGRPTRRGAGRMGATPAALGGRGGMVPRPPPASQPRARRYAAGGTGIGGGAAAARHTSRAGRASSSFSRIGQRENEAWATSAAIAGAPPRSFALLQPRNDGSNDNNSSSDVGANSADSSSATERYNPSADWFVEASTRPPVVTTIASAGSPERDGAARDDGKKAVAKVMRAATARLDALRQSVMDGNEYPPLLNDHTHTRAAANLADRSCYPAPARIGGVFSSFVGTLHLSYNQSIFARVKKLRASATDDDRPHLTTASKINWTGLPRPTAAPGPTGGRTAPAVEMSLTTRRRDGAKALLVYEMLEKDANRAKMAAARRGRHGGRYPVHNGAAAADQAIGDLVSSTWSPSRKDLRRHDGEEDEEDPKFLYGIKPIISTNATGDGRIHAFRASQADLEERLNEPLEDQVRQRGGALPLDIKSPSSPKQRPRFHGYSSADGPEPITLTMVGLQSPKGKRKTLGGAIERGPGPVIAQSALRPSQKSENRHMTKARWEAEQRAKRKTKTKAITVAAATNRDDEAYIEKRYWSYVHTQIGDAHVAPLDGDVLRRIISTHLNSKIVPPGLSFAHRPAPGGDVDPSAAAREQVSMISMATSLLPGSAEQLLLKTVFRLDGRFWAAVRSQMRELSADLEICSEAYEATASLERAVQESELSGIAVTPDIIAAAATAESAREAVDNQRSSTTRRLLALISEREGGTEGKGGGPSSHLAGGGIATTLWSESERQGMCSETMKCALAEMKAAKDMIDVLREIETDNASSSSPSSSLADMEFIEKYVCAEHWRFEALLFRVLQNTELNWLQYHHQVGVDATADEARKRATGRASPSNIRKQRKEAAGGFQRLAKEEVTLAPVIAAQRLRRALLELMVDIAEAELANLEDKCREKQGVYDTACRIQDEKRRKAAALAQQQARENTEAAEAAEASSADGQHSDGNKDGGGSAAAAEVAATEGSRPSTRPGKDGMDDIAPSERIKKSSSLLCAEAACSIARDRVDTVTAALACCASFRAQHSWYHVLEDAYEVYRTSVCKSILDYLLQDPRQRERTLIDRIPSSATVQSLAAAKVSSNHNIVVAESNVAGWGWDYALRLPPPSVGLRQAVESARFSVADRPEGTVLNNILLVDLTTIWQPYRHVLLVDLPDTDIGAQQMAWSPLDWTNFERLQSRAILEGVRVLQKDWHPRAIRVFLDAAEDGCFEDMAPEVLTHFLESAASIMRSQLWSVVLNSIERFVAFFRRFSGPSMDLRRTGDCSMTDHARSVQRCAIKVYLLLTKRSNGGGAEVVFAGEQNELLGALHGSVVNLFNQVAEALAGTLGSSLQSVGARSKAAAAESTKSNTSSRASASSFSSSSSSSNPLAMISPPPVGRTAVLNFFHSPAAALADAGYAPSSLVTQRALLPEGVTRLAADVRQARNELEDIVARNCEAARGVLAIYESIASDLTSVTKRRALETMGRKGFDDGANQEHSVANAKSFQDQLDTILTAADTILRERLDLIPSSAFLVVCTGIKDALCDAARDLAKVLLKNLTDHTISRNIKIQKRFELIRTQAERVPATSEELSKIESYFEATLARGGEVEQLKHIARGLLEQTQFLLDNSTSIVQHIYVEDVSTTKCGSGFLLSEAQLRPTGRTIDWLRRTDGIISAGKGRLRLERDRIEGQLKRSREAFAKDLTTMMQRVEEFVNVVELSRLKEMEGVLEEMSESLAEAQAQGVAFNEEEAILGLAITKFAGLDDLKAGLAPFLKLWGVASLSTRCIREWTDVLCVFDLDAEKIEKEVQGMLRTCGRLANSTLVQETAPGTAQIVSDVQDNCQAFQKRIPLIAVLSNKGMRTRHWEEIDEIVSFQIRPNPKKTLDDYRNIAKYMEELQRVSDQATKEFGVEKMLGEMNEAWLPLTYTFNTSFRETGAAIFKGESVDMVYEILEEQLVKIQTLSSLPQAEYFSDEVERQQKFLDDTQRIADLVLEVQAAWIYLYPVFGSEDIKRALEMESNAFAGVDAEWRRITTRAQVHPQVVRVSAIENIIERLEAMSKSVEKIQLGLKRYLDEKRQGFPRFFFLSDEELLEILAETRNPRKIQPFLRKIFEGIRTVKFQEGRGGDENALEIIAMVSGKSEQIWLSSPVDPMQYGSGACEKWLVDLENRMRDTICAELRVAIEQYDVTGANIEERAGKRNAWLLNRAAQVVLAIDQLQWTAGAEQALRSEGWKGLVGYCKELESFQMEVVKLVRRPSLPKIHRSTLGALLTLDVHGLDVIKELAKERVSSVTDFEWTSQLRYYWYDEGLHVKIMNSDLAYGNEYIGNSGRLVITPLTDRCYRTLMGALYLQYGGAPEGPAGTGKTETVKDLSKAISRQCIVWNCSDGLDAAAMAKFFKGLAAAGAWACFDEFNRIPIEVLSVIAQQVSAIQVGIATQQETLLFEGTTLKLNWNCAVFITMNPGYAGRADLPDNLKALFRPVAMMVPDYAMISAIVLFSFGFMEGPTLAVKIVATYRLCSELLSNQPHYDYGMRAVKSVLTAAGNLRRKQPDYSESVLVMTAINQINKPKFLAQDLALYKGIMADLFLGAEEPEQDNSLLVAAIEHCCAEQQLQPHKAFVGKVIELREMVLVRHGLMIVGDPLSCKTSCMRVLQGALSLLCQREEVPCDLCADHELTTDVYAMNPKSVPLDDLYGYNDEVSHEWSDGVLSQIYRAAVNAARDGDTNRKWVMFDGPVDAVWIENMNTVLDDNRKLCLVSGEMIPLSPYMNMLFETLNLNQASPATVSRCGMVYMNAPDCTVPYDPSGGGGDDGDKTVSPPPALCNWMPHVASWMQHTLPLTVSQSQKCTNVITSLYSWIVPPLVRFMEDDLMPYQMIPRSGIAFVHALNVMFGSLIHDHMRADEKVQGGEEGNASGATSPPPSPNRTTRKGTAGSAGDEEEAAEDASLRRGEIFAPVLDAVFLFSVVWSFGAVLNPAGRSQFEAYFRELASGKHEKFRPPRAFVSAGTMFPSGKGSVFDYFLEIEHIAGKDSSTPPTKRVVWATWKDLVARQGNVPIDPEASFDSIIIPTAEGRCMKELLDTLVRMGRHPLLVGASGTGKSVYVQEFFNDRILPLTRRNEETPNIKAEFFCTMMQLSTFTTPRDIQTSLLECMSMKKSTRTITSKTSRKTLLIIDDMNMPEKEVWGAQPPLELIRQGVDSYAQWYDLDDKRPWKMETLQTLAAMGVPGGGRNALPVRLTRHYHVLGVIAAPTSTIKQIFGKILSWHTKRAGFSGPTNPLVSKMEQYVDGTLAVYNFALKNLKPTPKKSHYIFSLCDVRRVVQGTMLSLPKQFPDDASGTPAKVARLWAHEVTRVFSDRITDPEDLVLTFESVGKVMRSTFKVGLREVISAAFEAEGKAEGKAEGEGESESGKKPDDGGEEKTVNPVTDSTGPLELIAMNTWANFRSPKARNVYDEMPSRAASRLCAEAHLRDHNTISDKPMQLILFDYALQHLARIVRILLIPGGHGMLVGMGGSGRQSLTRLGAHIVGANLKQFQIASGYGRLEWKDDLREMLVACGTAPDPEDGLTVFLMTDTQIIDDMFIADVNSLLSSGVVPSLFSPAEQDMVGEKMRPMANAEGKELVTSSELFEFFVSKIRARLHVVLCFSPVGELLRRAIRKMPSIISCCSLNWFTAWPEAALRSVSSSLLADVPFSEKKIDGKSKGTKVDIRKECALQCQEFFTFTCRLSERFEAETRRKQYVTPLAYLELLSQYRMLLKSKRESVLNEKKRYDNGLEQLTKAGDAVEVMQEKLEKIRPVLIETQKDAADMMELVKQESLFAQKIKQGVTAEKAAAQGKADLAGEIRTDCERELAKAMPAMDAAVSALKSLKKADIDEMKSFKSPPGGVRLVAEVLCHMFFIKAVKVKDPNDPSKKVNDYWGTAKSNLLTGTDFLQRLFDYDKDHIPARLVKKIKPYLAKPEFQPKAMQRSSTAGFGISMWVRAIIEYDIAAKIVGPKQAAMEKATAEFEEIMAGVREKESELDEINKKLGVLEDKQKAAQARKDQLEKDVELTGKKIERAKSLVMGLGSEQKRWTDISLRLSQEYACLAGDVLLAAAQVSFLGVFTTEYRNEAATQWRREVKRRGIKVTEGGSLSQTLGDPVIIRQWNLQGLPTDSFSIENGITTVVGGKWPLFIDPQGQANAWVRAKEAAAQIDVLSLSDDSYLRKLKTCIRFGKPVLLEGVPEVLDMALDPLLLKMTVKKGGTMYMTIGGETIEFAPGFKLYMTTNLANPHFLPETAAKVTLINFQITSAGLREQLLGRTVAEEKPDLEEMKNKLILEGAENTRKLKDLESKILHVLQSSKGSILDDESAVNVLTSSKRLSNEIKEKQLAAKETEIEIDAARRVYVPVSRCATSLFMTLTQLEKIDPMYQYSLEWFMALFQTAIRNSRTTDKKNKKNKKSKKNKKNKKKLDEGEDAAELAAPVKAAPTPPSNRLVNEISRCVPEAEGALDRIIELNSYFADSVYSNICRSLFERHKLLFSLMLTVELMNCARPEIAQTTNALLRFLVTGGSGSAPKNPCSDWLPDVSWSEIHRLSKTTGGAGAAGGDTSRPGSRMDSAESTGAAADDANATEADAGASTNSNTYRNVLQHLPVKVRSSPDLWKNFMQAPNPAEEPIPGDWGSDQVGGKSALTQLHRMCVLRCFRKDAIIPAARKFVADEMSDAFLEPPQFDLAKAFKDSSASVPIVFVLSAGSDPTDSIFALGRKQEVQITTVSLGQGQDKKASRLLTKATKHGTWLVLQNCHLYPSWMPELDKKFKDITARVVADNEALPDDQIVHPEFRLWLTSKPNKDFPVSILQRSVKLTKEPPGGIRANIKSSLTNDVTMEPGFFDGIEEGPAAWAWKKLLFSVCLFHAAVQERRSFGSIGWNIMYEFSESDLKISLRQLRKAFETWELPPSALQVVDDAMEDGAKKEEQTKASAEEDLASLIRDPDKDRRMQVEVRNKLPFKALRYSIGACNYGGRVTDAADRVALYVILEDYINVGVIGPMGYRFTEDGRYSVPDLFPSAVAPVCRKSGQRRHSRSIPHAHGV